MRLQSTVKFLSRVGAKNTNGFLVFYQDNIRCNQSNQYSLCCLVGICHNKKYCCNNMYVVYASKQIDLENNSSCNERESLSHSCYTFTNRQREISLALCICNHFQKNIHSVPNDWLRDNYGLFSGNVHATERQRPKVIYQRWETDLSLR